MHVIVTDANILLAVAVGLAAEKAFRKPITAYTTSHTYAELLKYLPHFSERYKVSIEAVKRYTTAEILKALGI